ncbi:MAG: DUF5684 domain-containing protein [Micromonosporaceae bacterium]
MQNETPSGAGGVGAVGTIIYLALIVLTIAGMWKTFSKAGQPGWAAIIPIYNLVVLLKVVGRPLWWIVLYIIPIVSFIVWIINAIDLAKSYGKGAGLGILVALFPFIGFPVLGFGGAAYAGPSAEAAVAAA